MGLLLPIGIVAFSLVLPCIFLVWLLRAKVESRASLFSIVLLVAVDLVVDYLRGSLREPQGAAFNISSPLGNGTYYVVTGGANVFVNQHAMARVGTYAMDITRLNGVRIGSGRTVSERPAQVRGLWR